MSKLTDLIVQIARADIGQKEKSGNSGFMSAVKEAKMKLVGWLKGQSWCAYNSESYWTDAFAVYDREGLPLIKKYFSGSTVQTWKNFRASKEFRTSPDVPKLGALVIWKDGLKELGHMGVVSWIDKNGVNYKSIEGNTNEFGSREGTIVGENSHVVVKNQNTSKRYCLGFVYADRIA